MRLVALTTMLCVRDISNAVAFYRDKLGFDVVEQDEEIALLRLRADHLYVFAESPPTVDKPSVHLAPPPDPGRGSVILVLTVDDCRAAYDELRGRGVEFLMPPRQPPWGGWRCFAHDPDGHLLELEDWAAGQLAR